MTIVQICNTENNYMLLSEYLAEIIHSWKYKYFRKTKQSINKSERG